MRRQGNILREFQGVCCTGLERVCGEGVVARLRGRRGPVMDCPVGSLRRLGLDPESHGDSPSVNRADVEFRGEREKCYCDFLGFKPTELAKKSVYFFL